MENGCGGGASGEGAGHHLQALSLFNGEKTLTWQVGSNQLNFINTASVYISSSFYFEGFCFRPLPVLMRMMMMVWSPFLAHFCQTSLFQT